MIQFFESIWTDVPIVVIDTETTGVRPGFDKAVSVALVRFERGACVSSLASLVSPGMPIPKESTAIHGITDSMVAGAPTIEEFFGSERAQSMLRGAQPAAYNAAFDREFVAREAFDDWSWPWLDPLVFVREVDRFEKGKGRHTLAVTCARHGVELGEAHSAEHDALAAGELLFKVVPPALDLAHVRGEPDLGRVLLLQQRLRATQWFEFSAWLHNGIKNAL